MGHDLCFALRLMGRTPGFTAVAVLMIALGTGANAAMFSVIDAVMLRPAFPDSAHIASVYEERPGKAPTSRIPVAHLDALRGARPFTSVAGVSGVLAIMTGRAEDRRVDIDCVSASAFGLLGVSTEIGRVFTSDEDRPGAPAVIVISHYMWQREFAGRADALGQTITLDGEPNTVIGVMPPGFLGPFPSNRTEAWAPLGAAVGVRNGAGCHLTPASSVDVIARVHSSMTLQSAADALNASSLIDRHIQLRRADRELDDSYRTPLIALMATVGCVLLIACANVANLQLERLAGRRRERAVRLALGASRARLVRQTVTENLILSFTGAGAGLLLARVTLRSIVSLMPATVPHIADIGLDPRALVVTASLAILCGIAVGLVPALQSFGADSPEDLRASARGMTGGAQHLRRALVVAEVAASVVLLIGAALMVRTFLTLRPTDSGFATDNRTIMYTSLPGEWEVSAERRQFVSNVLDRLRSLPQVESAGASTYLPLSGYTSTSTVTMDGASAEHVWSAWVSAHFLDDMSATIVRGRAFSDTDNAMSAPVAIVNETFARQYFPAADPIGQSVTTKADWQKVASAKRIVGVMRDFRETGRDRIQRPEIYAPYDQEPGAGLLYFLVKTRGPAPQLESGMRAAVANARPGQLAERIEPMQTMVDRSVSRPKFGAWLFGVFAAIAVGLATLGLGAVIAWWVSQRTREIGVRMALGADAGVVTRLVVGQGVRLAVIGIAIGIAVSVFAARLLSDWLYGVSPNDAATLIVCCAAMLLITAAAAYWPARRASRVDPAGTLRAE